MSYATATSAFSSSFVEWPMCDEAVAGWRLRPGLTTVQLLALSTLFVAVSSSLTLITGFYVCFALPLLPAASDGTAEPPMLLADTYWWLVVVTLVQLADWWPSALLEALLRGLCTEEKENESMNAATAKISDKPGATEFSVTTRSAAIFCDHCQRPVTLPREMKLVPVEENHSQDRKNRDDNKAQENTTTNTAIRYKNDLTLAEKTELGCMCITFVVHWVAQYQAIGHRHPSLVHPPQPWSVLYRLGLMIALLGYDIRGYGPKLAEWIDNDKLIRKYRHHYIDCGRDPVSGRRLWKVHNPDRSLANNWWKKLASFLHDFHYLIGLSIGHAFGFLLSVLTTGRNWFWVGMAIVFITLHSNEMALSAPPSEAFYVYLERLVVALLPQWFVSFVKYTVYIQLKIHGLFLL
jgi:hypothetical protein